MLLQNQNAWIFVDEDGISSSVKSWISFQQEETKILKSNAEKDQIVPNATEICGGVLNGKPRTPEDVCFPFCLKNRRFLLDSEIEGFADAI